MNKWAPRTTREAALTVVETRLAADPDSTDLWFQRAYLLSELGRTEEARLGYLEVLSREPSHFAALNNLGTLLYETGFRSAARTAYAEAAAQHPDNPTAHVNLANLMLDSSDYAGAREHYETALRLTPDHPEAHQGLAIVLTELGDEGAACDHRRRGFESRSLTVLPYRGEAQPVAVLLLASSTGGNLPFRRLLDDRFFLTMVAAVEYWQPDRPLPPHHVVFNAIGDADLCRPAIEAAIRLLERTNRPVLNQPARVLPTGRAENTARLGTLPGIVAPATVVLSRELLSGPESSAVLARHGFCFPLLLRSPGFHTGRYFSYVPYAEALGPALSQLPGDEQMVIQYLDARGIDGKFRKYRAMIVDGHLYPMHLAVASDWKVHYFSSDMADHPEYRAEEAAFLEDMPRVLGPRATAGLEQIRQTLGLDYGGIDFAVSASGDVLLFEANATMVLNPPEPDERWNYRRAAVSRIQDAVRHMLLARASQA